MRGQIGRKNVAQLAQLTTNWPLCSQKAPRSSSHLSSWLRQLRAFPDLPTTRTVKAALRGAVSLRQPSFGSEDEGEPQAAWLSALRP